MTQTHGYQKIVTDLDEIGEVLSVAQLHNWRFAYSVGDMIPSVTFITELKQVDCKAQVVTIGNEVKYVGLEPFEAMHFNLRNGGISISFSSHLLPSNLDSSGKRWRGECQIAFPKSIVYGQKRQAVRVNLGRLETVPITLFTGTGSHFTGSVDDISLGGLRARFASHVVKQFENSDLISDSSLMLPDGSTVKTRVQLLGGICDEDRKVGYLRFRFLELNRDVEIRLETLIEESLRKLPLSASA